MNKEFLIKENQEILNKVREKSNNFERDWKKGKII